MTESHASGLTARRFDARVLSGIGVMVAVVEAGSFVAAAKLLGLTQSGVSRAIARLEARLGVRLFQRSARAVTLTHEGQRFFDDVLPRIEGIELAAEQAAQTSVQARGKLRVAVDALAARVLLGPHLASFLADYREVALELVVGDQRGDLIANGFDAAIRFGEPAVDTLIKRKLLDTRVLTCASRVYLSKHGTPKHPRELAKHETIGFLDPLRGRPYAWEYRRGEELVEAKLESRLVVNDSATKLAACMAGFGIAQILDRELDSAPGHGLTQLFAAWSEAPFPLYLVYPSRHLPPAKVRALVEFVLAAARR